MFKHIFLSLTILSGSISISNSSNIVESIEYNANSQTEGYLSFDISLVSNNDYITSYISFSDEENNMYDKFYKKTIYVNGKVNSFMHIPIDIIEEKIYVNFEFESYNVGEKVFSINIPIYKTISKVCNLNELYYCKSDVPTIVNYHDGKIDKIYEKISIDYKGNVGNALKLNKIIMFANNYLDSASANLYIYAKRDKIDIYNDGEKYVLPLTIYEHEGIIEFEFANDYYINEIDGVTKEEYSIGYVKSKKIIFPYDGYNYDCYLEIENLSKSFEDVVFSFKHTTKGKLIGNCIDDKYCIRRNYV